MADLTDEGSRGEAKHTVEGDRAVITLTGEFDIANVEVLRAVCAEIGAVTVVVVDAADLEFIDSSGIAVLLQTAERFGALDVRNPPPVLRRIIEISGLGDRLRTDP